MRAEPTPELPTLLERVGVAYLRRLSQRRPGASAQADVHVLDADEQDALRRIERGAVWRAGAAGGASALVAATAEALATTLVDASTEPSLLGAPLAVWLWSLGVAAVAAVLEIAYVYRDALASVHALACAVGADPAGSGAVFNALARAALELPNAARPAYGVDPRREASRAQLLAASLAYKSKVALTSVLLKALVRRALGRAAVRVALPYVAVPVSVAWNALVSRRVLREARVRVMGPSYAKEAIAALGPGPLPAAIAVAALRAVASAIVRTRDLHPNLVALLLELRARAEQAPPADLDDTRAFLDDLRGLDSECRPPVLAVLAVAAVVDGRITAAEHRLWREARTTCGLADAPRALESLCQAFVEGRPQLPDGLAPAPRLSAAP